MPTASRSSFRLSDGLLLLLLGSIWGCSALFVRVVVDHVAPLWLVAGRALGGLTVAAIVVALRRERLPRAPRTWLHLAVVGAGAMAVPWTLLAAAGDEIPSGLATLLGAPTPAMTLAIAAAVGLERVTARRAGGMLLAFAGIVLVVSGSATASGRLGSVAMILASVVLFSAGGVYTRRYLHRLDPAVSVAGQLTAAAVVALPLAVRIEVEPSLAAPASVWIAWLLLACVSTSGGFILYYRLIQRVGASNAAMVSYLSPAVGLALGWFARGEQVAMEAVVGVLLTVPGIWLAQRVGAEDAAPPRRRSPAVFVTAHRRTARPTDVAAGAIAP
ncbi:MAG: DMT family transporter [Actinobacteria bacterium]|nr:DMT family transporter [Actinomycetota bacterium]